MRREKIKTTLWLHADQWKDLKKLASTMDCNCMAQLDTHPDFTHALVDEATDIPGQMVCFVKGDGRAALKPIGYVLNRNLA